MLRKCKFSHANLSDINLYNADLNEIDIQDSVFENIKSNNKTGFIDEFK